PPRRPRSMKEEADSVVDPAFAQLGAERDHVIVLHPDCIVSLDQRTDRVGKSLIGALVAAGKVAFVLGEVDTVVEQRPEGAIGVPVVVLLYILLLEVDRRCGNAASALQRDLSGKLFGEFTRPAKPDAAHFAQCCGQCDCESSLRPSFAFAIGRRYAV